RLILALVLALPMMTYAQEARDPQNVITVTGAAQVFAAPDEATVSLGVMQQSPIAAEAQAGANEVVAKLLQKLAGLKIAKENIQTSRLALSPQTEYQPGRPPRVTGYQATNTITVRLTDFDLIGKVIDAGVGSGVNNIEGVS